MRINWRVRFRNYGWLTTFALGMIALLYQFIKVINAARQGVPPQELLEETAKMLLFFLWQIGVITDPTTKGTSDSKMAMTYKKPRQEEHDPSDAPVDKEV